MRLYRVQVVVTMYVVAESASAAEAIAELEVGNEPSVVSAAEQIASVDPSVAGSYPWGDESTDRTVGQWLERIAEEEAENARLAALAEEARLQGQLFDEVQR